MTTINGLLVEDLKGFGGLLLICSVGPLLGILFGLVAIPFSTRKSLFHDEVGLRRDWCWEFVRDLGWAFGGGVAVNFASLLLTFLRYVAPLAASGGQNALAAFPILVMCIVGSAAVGLVVTAVLGFLLVRYPQASLTRAELQRKRASPRLRTIAMLTARCCMLASLGAVAYSVWHQIRAPEVNRRSQLNHSLQEEAKVNAGLHPALQVSIDRNHTNTNKRNASLGVRFDPSYRTAQQVNDKIVRDALVSLRGDGFTLVSLQLNGTQIGDDSLYFIAERTTLTQLFVRGTSMTDQGLAELHSLKRMEELNLSRTSITDAGLKVLPSLPLLKVLYLNETKITDAAIPTLLECPSLQALEVNQTDITPAGKKQLQEHLRLKQ